MVEILCTRWVRKYAKASFNEKNVSALSLLYIVPLVLLCEWLSHAQNVMVTWLPLEENKIIIIYDTTSRRKQSNCRNRFLVCSKCLTDGINA
jgi:hypothetical protein